MRQRNRVVGGRTERRRRLLNNRLFIERLDT